MAPLSSGHLTDPKDSIRIAARTPSHTVFTTTVFPFNTPSHFVAPHHRDLSSLSLAKPGSRICVPAWGERCTALPFKFDYGLPSSKSLVLVFMVRFRGWVGNRAWKQNLRHQVTQGHLAL